MKTVFVSAIACLIVCLVVNCNGASVEKPQPDAKGGLPVLVVRQSNQGSAKPDFWLMWLEPYKGVIPDPVMQAINQNIRPQTEAATAQILSQMPGGDQLWSVVSQFQSTLNNMGGLQSLLGSLGNFGGSGGSNRGSPGAPADQSNSN